jgi:hypothetical protein
MLEFSPSRAKRSPARHSVVLNYLPGSVVMAHRSVTLAVFHLAVIAIGS